MRTESGGQEFEFDLVRGGLFDHWTRRLELDTNIRRRLLKVLILLGVTWAPLFLLSYSPGVIGDLKVSFHRDPEVHARYLAVVPLLELAAVVVSISLLSQTRHLREMGVVPARELEKFDAAVRGALQLRRTKWADTFLAVFSLAIAIVVRVGFGVTDSDASWERPAGSLSLAGWWHTCVSLPILYFFLLRWFWIFFVWARFLFRVSRLDLELTPTHPDRAGGLGFLGWGSAAWSPVLIAFSTFFSAAFAQLILHGGESLASLKYHVGVFVVVAVLAVHAPLFAFTSRLSRCRFAGLLEFGALVWRHDRSFEEKWMNNSLEQPKENFLGSADIQSLADVATPYDHIDRMRLLPFDSKAFVVLVLATMLPMVPLVGTEIPLHEIFARLAEMLV
jgi:hypothetical protein